MPILKHRLELEGISHVVSLVSFLDVKAENNFTNKIVAHQTTIESPKNSSLHGQDLECDTDPVSRALRRR